MVRIGIDVRLDPMNIELDLILWINDILRGKTFTVMLLPPKLLHVVIVRTLMTDLGQASIMQRWLVPHQTD